MSSKYSVKEHMQAHHSGAANFHEAEAASHAGHAKDCEALADCAKRMDHAEYARHFTSMAKRHVQDAARHTAEAERHGDMQKLVESMVKAAGMNENRIVPDGIRGVIPAPGLTPIPRYGQRSLDKVEVPIEFAHLVETGIAQDF